MEPCRHKAGNMRNIHHEHRAHLIGNLSEFLKINGSRISGCTGNYHLRLALQCNLSHIIVIEESFVIDAIRHAVKVLARHINRRPMGQMSAMIQIHAHKGISRLHHRKKYRHICLCAGMGLYVHVLTAKHLSGSCNRQILYHVDTLTAAVISFSGISFCILIGQRAAHGSHYCFAYPVF